MSKLFPRPTFALGAAAACSLLALGMAAPAVAAMTEVYYQRAFDLKCSGNACHVDLPKVAANTRLNITRVSCEMQTSSSGLFGVVSFQDVSSAAVGQFFAPIQVGQKLAKYNQEMDILVSAQKSIGIALAADGSASSASCTLTGRVEKFS